MKTMSNTKSWIVTLLPFAIALGEMVKAFLTNEPLTEQEIELIKYCVMLFVTSGAFGITKSVAKSQKPS